MFQISQKLYVKVALAIALIAIIISLLASALSYYFGLEARHQSSHILAMQLSKTVEKTAVVAAYINDADLAQEIVDGLVINDLIQGVKLSNDVGLEAISGDLGGQNEQISTRLAHPFIHEEKVGSLDVYLAQKYIEQQTKKEIIKETLIKLLLSLILAFFVSLVVHRKLTKPIQKLIDNFEHIDPHHPETMQVLPHKNKDEIGKLIQGINTLIQGLHQSFSVEKNLRIKTQNLENQFRLIFEQASAGICLVDQNNNISAFNPAFSRYFTPFNNETLNLKHFPSLFVNQNNLEQILSSMRNDPLLDQVALDLEYSDGNQQKWMHCLFAKVTEQRIKSRNDIDSIIEVILYDITERTEREHQTRFEADHDPLTHLLNRRAGEDRLTEMLTVSLENQQPLVLMMIDLDKFKPINDTYGHKAGDKVLLQTTQRITQLYSNEQNVCIRWGGDEFVVAYYNDESHQTIKNHAETLLSAIQQPIQIQSDISCTISASIGLVIAPIHGHDLHELLMHADNTMYQAKEQRLSNVQFYAPAAKK
ncbi:MAG: diguanylate cyclase [Paraglaciecola sp.]|uniref:diguanylate cyclase domain-containing protein n=1 Tax=Paraglaciecola sp. TaxID=1920173 RepID=UPI003266F2DD